MADQDIPQDELLLEAVITEAVANRFRTVPEIVNVWERERETTIAEEDGTIGVMPDPVSGMPLVNILEVDLVGLQEGPYTSDRATVLTFAYNAYFELGFRDRWAKPGVPYGSSTAMFRAALLKARRKFKESRTLGYNNVEHKFLQMRRAGLVPDDKNGGLVHSAEWSLTVVVTNVVC